MKKCPIENLKKEVLEAGIATAEEFAAVEEAVEAEIQAAVKFAIDSEYPPAEDAYTDVFQQGVL